MKAFRVIIFLLLAVASEGQYVTYGFNKGATASFPTTSVLDTFIRANENPLNATNWTCPFFSANSLKIVSNQAVGQVSDSACEWNTSFGPETEVYVTVATLPTANSSTQLFARWSGGASGSGYQILYCNSGGASCDCGVSGFCIARFNSGSPTILATNATTLSGGDSYGSILKGAVVSVYKKTGGVWGSSPVFSATDGTPILTSGDIALGAEDTTAAFTNFGGGTGTE